MKIQYVSDLHAEFHENIDFIISKKIVKPIAPVLIVAGDWASGKANNTQINKMLDWMSANWEQVWIVPGNHDFWGSSYYSPDLKYINKNLRSNVFLRNNCTEVIDDKYFIFSCMWSFIPDAQFHYCSQAMNDFNQIVNFSPEKQTDIHNHNLKFIIDEIDRLNDKDIVVVTHHSPTFKLVDDYYIGNRVNCCYSSDLDILLEQTNSKVKYWVTGHSHTYKRMNVEGVDVMRNPVGYCKYSENKNYKDRLIY